MKRNLTFALFCGTLVPMAALAQERPNIIYIMTDQQVPQG